MVELIQRRVSQLPLANRWSHFESVRGDRCSSCDVSEIQRRRTQSVSSVCLVHIWARKFAFVVLGFTKKLTRFVGWVGYQCSLLNSVEPQFKVNCWNSLLRNCKWLAAMKCSFVSYNSHRTPTILVTFCEQGLTCFWVVKHARHKDPLAQINGILVDFGWPPSCNSLAHLRASNAKSVSPSLKC